MKQQTVETQAYAAIKGEDYTPTIRFHLETQDIFALAYAYLIGVELNKSGLIILYFTSHRVEIRGRSLEDLFAALTFHQVISVYEHSLTSPRPPVGECVVDSIKIDVL